jgi:hypothetical protein
VSVRAQFPAVDTHDCERSTRAVPWRAHSCVQRSHSCERASVLREIDNNRRAGCRPVPNPPHNTSLRLAVS